VGAQTVQRDALGRETTYAYDQLGRRVGRTLPDGQNESMSYDIIGNLATRTDFNGHTTTYTYDLMNRLTQKRADAGHPSLSFNHAPKTILYGYDNLGRQVSAESRNSGGQVLYQDAWTYDVRGRTTNHASSNGAITYDYDATGNLTLTQSNHPQGGAAVTYDYDGLNRLRNVYDHNVDDGAGNVPAAAHYAYDGVGNLSTMSYSNGVQHAYTYNTLNRLTQLTVTDALSNVLHSYNHTLNAAGHKTQVVEADGRTVNYAFDRLHRLTSETIAASPGPLGVNGVASYAYDKVSNRISRTSSIAGVVNQSLAFNNNDQIDGVATLTMTTAARHRGRMAARMSIASTTC
jgi:YD repeat-containing protein